MSSSRDGRRRSLTRYRSPHLFLALSASSSASAPHARLAPRRNLPPTPSRTSHHSRIRIRYWDIAASTVTYPHSLL
ncbi:hypothetical protein GY45DRAFT_1321900 [Cubamyces sp. BRFM 1775]|nr:hypothetical protein GY45DRAFT_1321900 [Cubamyces sp. BRFM 1775]